jgi:Ca2+-binding RTX toxin-like protein
LKISIPLQLAAFGLLTLIVVSVATAFAAGITVPASNIGLDTVQVTADDLKPSACNGITLTQTISGSGTLTGTSGNDLIIGSAGADSIDGMGGDDCILGGDGDDTLIGNEGRDVCLGGPRNDIFINCEIEIQE